MLAGRVCNRAVFSAAERSENQCSAMEMPKIFRRYRHHLSPGSMSTWPGGGFLGSGFSDFF
jgi:hypothetical protein